MAERKYPSELNTRTLRVNIDDWEMLLKIAKKAGITVAEALHLAVAERLGPLDLELDRQAEVLRLAVAEVKRQAEANRQEQVTGVSPAKIPTPAVSFEPKTISSNGTTHVKLKSIQ